MRPSARGGVREKDNEFVCEIRSLLPRAGEGGGGGGILDAVFGPLLASPVNGRYSGGAAGRTQRYSNAEVIT